MKLLLDTHVLLWAAGDPGRLSTDTQAILQDRDNEILFSVVSLWEIVIKRGLGRNDFRAEPRGLYRGLLENGYRELGITSDHAFTVETLPPIYRDPFDRILVAQAMVEGATLITADEMVAQYPGMIRRA